MSTKTMNLDTLLETNQTFTDAFKDNPLMQLIDSSVMHEARNRVRLLDCIQVFSNYFQKTVMLRAALNQNHRYVPIARSQCASFFYSSASRYASICRNGLF